MTTNRYIALAAALACICSSAQAQHLLITVPGYPDRVIRLNIEKAIRRALTPPSRAAPLPAQAIAPPPQRETREQWRQRLFDEMRSYCTQWPTDSACGPNALSGGSGR